MQVLKTVFPEILTDNFEFVNFEEQSDRLDYWLDERGYMSREDYKKGTVREYGFTDERVIQDLLIIFSRKENLKNRWYVQNLHTPRTTVVEKALHRKLKPLFIILM